MRLIRAHEIRLKSDSEKVTAFIQDAAGKLEGFGTNVGDLAGSGADVPAAHEDLARSDPCGRRAGMGGRSGRSNGAKGRR